MWFNVLSVIGWLKGGVETPISEVDRLPVDTGLTGLATADNQLPDNHQVTVSNFPATQIVSDGGGSLTVDGSVSVVNFPVTQAVSGTVALDSATLEALENVNATVSGSVSVSNFPATQAVSGTVALDSASLAALEQVTVSATDLDIRNLSSAQDSVAVTDGGGSLTVDGTVSVNNFPATQAVSGTVALDSASLAALETINVGNFPATQQVSGTVEITNDVGNPIPVNGTVSVGNFPSTQAVSDGGGSLTVDGSVSVNNTVAVSATDLDIRNLSSAQDNVRAFDSTDSEYLRVATSVTSSGDTLLIAPTSGKRIRLQWVYAINDPTASTSTKITIKLGSAVQYVAWAISKRQQLTGDVDAPLIINLTNTGDVAVTVFYQEVD